MMIQENTHSNSLINQNHNVDGSGTNDGNQIENTTCNDVGYEYDTVVESQNSYDIDSNPTNNNDKQLVIRLMRG